MNDTFVAVDATRSRFVSVEVWNGRAVAWDRDKMQKRTQQYDRCECMSKCMLLDFSLFVVIHTGLMSGRKTVDLNGICAKYK